MSRITLAGVLGILAVTVMACASPSIPGTATPTGTSSAGSTIADAGTGDDSDPLGPEPGMNPCALVPAADVATLIGQNSGGKLSAVPTLAMTTTDCTWKNDDTQGLVLVMIGRPGTAPGGSLPAVDPDMSAYYSPLDDGMRLLGTDKIEFAAGDRYAAIRVSTNPLHPTLAHDRTAGVALAKAVRAQL